MKKFLAFLYDMLSIFFPIQKVEIPAPVPESGGRELPEHDDAGSIVLAVIVGHEEKDQGAKMAGTFETEYSYNKRVVELMQKLTHEKIKVVPIFRDGVGIEGAYKLANEVHKADLAIELHFNGYNGTVQGTSTLCTTSPNDVEFAHLVQAEVCKVFKREGKQNRGVKAISRTARGGTNVHSFPGGANCLVEPFFGDNELDAEMGRDLIEQYAECLLRAVTLYSKKIDLIK